MHCLIVCSSWASWQHPTSSLSLETKRYKTRLSGNSGSHLIDRNISAYCFKTEFQWILILCFNTVKSREYSVPLEIQMLIFCCKNKVSLLQSQLTITCSQLYPAMKPLKCNSLKGTQQTLFQSQHKPSLQLTSNFATSHRRCLAAVQLCSSCTPLACRQNQVPPSYVTEIHISGMCKI